MNDSRQRYDIAMKPIDSLDKEEANKEFDTDFSEDKSKLAQHDMNSPMEYGSISSETDILNQHLLGNVFVLDKKLQGINDHASPVDIKIDSLYNAEKILVIMALVMLNM